MNEFLLAALGLLSGWLITHIYYVISNREQRILYEKLPQVIRRALLEDVVSVAELNRMIEARTRDAENPGPLNYNACPKCGEPVVKGTDFVVDTDVGDDGEAFHTATPYKTLSCESCDWQIDELTVR